MMSSFAALHEYDDDTSSSASSNNNHGTNDNDESNQNTIMGVSNKNNNEEEDSTSQDTTDEDDDDDEEEDDDVENVNNNDHEMMMMFQQQQQQQQQQEEEAEYSAEAAAQQQAPTEEEEEGGGGGAGGGNEEDSDDDDDEDDDDSEGDGELPLATPYPWNQDDYELTLHHEPKRRKQVGAGMLYVKRLLLEDDDNNAKFEEATILSTPAKAILKQLYKEHTKKHVSVAALAASAEDSDDDDDDDDEEEESDDDDDEDEEAKKSRRQLPGPRLWTSGLESQSIRTGSSCNNGLFYNILEAMEQEHPLNVTTRHILRLCALKLKPGVLPGNMDAKEFICCALHFLSSEWTSPDQNQLPSLPLLRYDNATAPGNARDLEKRSFEKAYDWKLDDLNLGELEKLFTDSPSSASQLQWISRIRFCPRAGGGVGGKHNSPAEATILLKGTIPARMSKSTKSSGAAAGGGGGGANGGAGPKKRKKSAAKTTTATQGIVMRAEQQQGKQFPFHPFGEEEEEE